MLNNEIQCARDVTKSNTFRVETFRPNELGFLGYADSDGQVVFYRTPTRKHTTDTPFNVSGLSSLPRVDIVYAYAGADGLLVDAVRSSDGLVLAGFGGGTYPPAVVSAAAEAVQEGIPVVLASRATAGRVIMTPQKDEQGFDRFTFNRLPSYLPQSTPRMPQGAEQMFQKGPGVAKC